MSPFGKQKGCPMWWEPLNPIYYRWTITSFIETCQYTTLVWWGEWIVKPTSLSLKRPPRDPAIGSIGGYTTLFDVVTTTWAQDLRFSRITLRLSSVRLAQSRNEGYPSPHQRYRSYYRTFPRLFDYLFKKGTFWVFKLFEQASHIKMIAQYKFPFFEADSRRIFGL